MVREYVADHHYLKMLNVFMRNTDLEITKCTWCNTEHSYQFVNCKNCRKTRIDIWQDQKKGEAYFIVGAVLLIISIVIFYVEIPPSSSPRFYDMLTTLLSLISICVALSCALMFFGSKYFSRARKKIRYNSYAGIN